MKKIKILIASFLVLGFLACDQEDAPVNNIYDNVGGQSLVSFKGTSSDLSVVIDDTGTVDVIIETSTVSTSDRTVTVSVDASSTANPENYSLASNTVTIPANEYFGTLTINGVDNSVETSAETIVLNMDSTSWDSTMNSAPHTVSIFQVCPVPSDFFVGDYLIEQMSPQVDGYSLSHGSIVTVSAPSETVRSFDTEAYISYCAGTFFTFNVNLVCNEFIVPFQNTTCRCVSSVDWWGPATNPESYDLSDDSVLFVTFTDDAQSDCGAPAQTTYRFTKQL